VIKKAENFAKNYLIIFGIEPKSPKTGYGYIKLGEKIDESIYKVEEFKEKPDFEKAKKYLSEGYLWNSGMFLFNTKLFMEKVKKYAPEVYENFEKESIEETYKNIPEISVDYGIIEKEKDIVVGKLNVYWSDLGSFDSIYESLEKDENGNIIKGECIIENSKNNLIITEKLTSLINLQDLIIINTDDALLISKRGESEKVKKIYEILKKKKDKRATTHRTVYKPWGKYTVLEEGNNFKIKRITVLPGKRLSLQRHFHRSEHWVVVHGMAKITVNNEEKFLRTNESTFIRQGELHRLENPGKIPLEIIEVQIGEYVEEDDIERVEDDYKRK
ncbi:MAG: mannose-1-phosphate guanylyltransferase/mannose-6-phosphate isomerase, partial [Candidatus Altarchaeaceae archaeon]